MENTLVVITSDHGEDLGEHGLFGHGRSLYSQEVHVPLVIRGRQEAARGRVVGEPVSCAICRPRSSTCWALPRIRRPQARHWPEISSPAWIDSASSSSPAYSEVALRLKVSKNPNRAPAWRGPMQSVVAARKGLYPQRRRMRGTLRRIA